MYNHITANLTHEERERLAYISGDLDLSGALVAAQDTEEDAHTLREQRDDLMAALTEAVDALRYAAQEATGRVRSEIVGGWLHHAHCAQSLLARLERGS